jgi:hypothetical protein
MRGSAVVAAISIALLLTGTLGAQTVVPIAGPFEVSPSGYGARVAPLQGGDFVVVWSNDGTYLSKVSGGSPSGPAFVSNGFYPDVDSDGAGNFWVVWDNFAGVYGNRFDSSLTELESDVPLSGFYSAYNANVGVAKDTGNFVVKYQNYGYSTVAGFNADASAPTFSPQNSGGGYSSRLAVDPSGNFVVVWGVGYETINARTFDPVGQEQATFEVAPLSSYSYGLDVAPVTTGEFVVVWAEYDYFGFKAKSAVRPMAFGDLMARKINLAGPVADAVTVAAAPFSGVIVEPAVAANGSYFVAVWDESSYVPGKTAKASAQGAPGTRGVRTFAPGTIKAQAMTVTGSPIGGAIDVGSGFAPDVAMDDDSNFLVIWQGNSIDAAQFQITIPCPNPIPPTLISPVGGQTVSSPVTFQWTAVTGAVSYDLYVGQGTSPALVGSTTGTSLSVSLDSGVGDWYVVVNFDVGCPTATSTTGQFLVEEPFVCPDAVAPTLVNPADGAEFEAGTIVTFEWTAVPGITRYELWARVNGGVPKFLGATANLTLERQIEEGTTEWYVIAYFGTSCNSATSLTRTLGTAVPPPPPCGLEAQTIPSIVGEATTGETYVLRWDDLGPGVSNYHVQESADATFTSLIEERTVSDLETAFTHPGLTAPTAFYYRVAGIPDCDTTKKGPYSVVVRVVGIPKPEVSSTNPQVVTEFGNTDFVETFLFVPGFGGAGKTTSAATFTVESNEPWLTVSPVSGTLPPDGITVKLTADPGDLGLGANTATVLVTRDDGLGKAGFGSTTTGVPVAVSLVTPVKPVPKGVGPPDNALVIPAVANVPGINSKWFSDVKVTNRSGQLINYELNFTATDRSGVVEGKQTRITIRPGQTVALDDVVRQWFGQGSLNDGTNGALEIRPLNFSGKVGPEAAPQLATVASSRSYTRSDSNLASYGQFIPGVPFSTFLKSGVAGASLMMQQVSQTASLRTNFGLVEGAGKDVNVLMTAYDREGVKLGEFPVSLKAGEHKQLNSLLAQSGITVEDGRMTVQIVSGEGAVTSYASVVASGTGDPSLVPGVDPTTLSAKKYVLPGVADLRAGGANWRSDVRIFNGNQFAESVNVFFYPQGQTTPLGPVELQVAPGQIRVIPGVVESLFGQQDLGGALHVVPISGQNSSLVVSGETYDVGELGKYGQFISGVTEDNAIGVGAPGLEIMQVESSAQFRTNLGLAEVTGQPATVQIQLTVPNSLVAPTRVVQLGGNEFQQLNGIVKEMTNGRDVYNGRLTVRVTGGVGKVTAYGSTVDNQTQDGTYSPGQ